MSPKSSGERGLEPPIAPGGPWRGSSVGDARKRRPLQAALTLIVALALIVLLAVIAFNVY
jgi:hypothetical protein